MGFVSHDRPPGYADLRIGIGAGIGFVCMTSPAAGAAEV